MGVDLECELHVEDFRIILIRAMRGHLNWMEGVIAAHPGEDIIYDSLHKLFSTSAECLSQLEERYDIEYRNTEYKHNVIK